MASVRKQIHVDTNATDAWDAPCDLGALHQRLVAGFARDMQLDGRDRIVTFHNGAVLRERLIDRDDDTRRLAWSIVDGPYTHHNGVAEVLADDDGGTVFQWTTDLLPDELAPRTSELMERGLQAIRRTLESVVGETSVSSDRSILRSEAARS